MNIYIFIGLMFFLVLIINLILCIPIFLIYKLDGLLDLKLMLFIEFLIIISMFLAPIKDGGIFLQAQVAEGFGFIIIIRQISILIKLRRNKGKKF